LTHYQLNPTHGQLCIVYFLSVRSTYLEEEEEEEEEEEDST